MGEPEKCNCLLLLSFQKQKFLLLRCHLHKLFLGLGSSENKLFFALFTVMHRDSFVLSGFLYCSSGDADNVWLLYISQQRAG